MANFLDKVGLQEVAQLLKDYINNKEIFILGYYDPGTNTFRSVGKTIDRVYTKEGETNRYVYKDGLSKDGKRIYEHLIEGDLKKLYIDQTYSSNDVYRYTGTGYIKLGNYPDIIYSGESTPWNKGVPAVGPEGGMSIGNAIEFHTLNDSGFNQDINNYLYDARLQVANKGLNIDITLPSQEGTLALTSQLPTTASTTNSGIVKVGNGLSVTDDGTLSANLDDSLVINSNKISVKDSKFVNLRNYNNQRRVTLSNGDVGYLWITDVTDENTYVLISYDEDDSYKLPKQGVPYKNTLFVSIDANSSSTQVKIIPLELYDAKYHADISVPTSVKIFGDNITEGDYKVDIISYYNIDDNDGSKLLSVWEHITQMNTEELTEADTFD